MASASRIAAKEGEYPIATLNCGRKIAGSRFPAAERRAAAAEKRKIPDLAMGREICVGLLCVKRVGAAVSAMGRRMSVSKASTRRVLRGPTCVRRLWIAGDIANPPTPVPERMKPSADPRCEVKYSGAVERMGK